MKRNLVSRAIWPVEKMHWEKIKERVPQETINGIPKIPCTFGKLERSISQEGWDKLCAKEFPKEQLQLALLRRSVQYAVENSEKRGVAMDNATLAVVEEIRLMETALRRTAFELIAGGIGEP